MSERTFPRNDVLGPKSTLAVVAQWKTSVTENSVPGYRSQGSGSPRNTNSPRINWSPTKTQGKKSRNVGGVTDWYLTGRSRYSPKTPSRSHRYQHGCVKGTDHRPDGRYSRDQLQPVGEHFRVRGTNLSSSTTLVLDFQSVWLCSYPERRIRHRGTRVRIAYLCLDTPHTTTT
jgi:hypothetical protein